MDRQIGKPRFTQEKGREKKRLASRENMRVGGMASERMLKIKNRDSESKTERRKKAPHRHREKIGKGGQEMSSMVDSKKTEPSPTSLHLGQVCNRGRPERVSRKWDMNSLMRKAAITQR